VPSGFRKNRIEQAVHNLWLDTETYCETPIKHGTYKYAEKAEVMLISWAVDDEEPKVWDRTFDPRMPNWLGDALNSQEVLVWFQNGDKFDWPVIERAMPWLADWVPQHRRRDTMVQAYCHSLPGNLEMMADALGVATDKRKLKTGRDLIRLFCMPRKDKPRATRLTHPEEWEQFKAYATQDIVAMRECQRRMPAWNYHGKQLELWFLDQKVNARGMCMDVDLAEAAVRASEISKTKLAAQTLEMTDGAVASATQRDEMLAHILASYNITLPDMQAATLERRIQDESLPEALRELLRVRLQSTTSSVAKYSALLRGVNSDGWLRGCQQFRGAMRTGRVGHRLFQPGNMPRPDMPASEIAWAIELLKLNAAHLVFPNVMRVCSNAIRGAIIAPPGHKLVVADLANIEGRVAAWLAGEDWKLQAFRNCDAGTGPDLYVLAYASSFNVDPSTVGKGPKRQIGKVQELMFQYGGGVGAWITGAATYGIDLDQMTEQVWDTLPKWARDEAEQYMRYLHEPAIAAYTKDLEKIEKHLNAWKLSAAEVDHLIGIADALCDERRLKAQHLLPERTFIACDAIKRLWRKANPTISSYWKELEIAVHTAIDNPGTQLECRKLKVRRDGAWLRIGLPSGRALCYPHSGWDVVVTKQDGTKKTYPGFSYMGLDQSTKKWQRIGSYGGKVFENVTQAVACDQLLECGPLIDEAGFDIVMSVHDDYLTYAPLDRPDLNADHLGGLMCADLGWNAGLPLAAAGFEAQRYAKKD